MATVGEVFSIPALLLGDACEPRSRLERGSHLIAYAEAAGIDPLDLLDPDVGYVVAFRLRSALGVA